MMLFVTGDGGLVLERRSVSAWWDRVSARPAWQRVVAGPVGADSPSDTAQISWSTRPCRSTSHSLSSPSKLRTSAATSPANK